MFTSVSLRGAEAEILWGYQKAVELKSWRIWKGKDGQWTLTGAVKRLDAFQSRQRNLVFTAPRDKGRWCWIVESLNVASNQLIARLGQPEQ